MSNMEREQFEGLPIEAKANVLIEHLMMLIDQICQTKMTLDTVMQEHAQQASVGEPTDFGNDFDITGNEVMQHDEEE